MRMVTLRRMVAGGLFMTLCAGCTTYYKVTDPTTGKVYYTTQMEDLRSGATSLKDARTGNEVTVQNSEVLQINKEQYETALHAPAPAPATAPAAPKKDPNNPFN